MVRDEVDSYFIVSLMQSYFIVSLMETFINTELKCSVTFAISKQLTSYNIMMFIIIVDLFLKLNLVSLLHAFLLMQYFTFGLLADGNNL